MNRGNEYIEKERKLCNMNRRGDFIFNILYISVFTFVVKKTGDTVSLAPPLVTSLTPWKKEENHRIKTLCQNKATL